LSLRSDFLVFMKPFITVALTFFLNSLHSQSSLLPGTWTECVGIDSIKTVECSEGFATYFVNKDGAFTLKDSAFCYPQAYAITGKWVMQDTKFTVYHNEYRRSDGCYSSGWSNTYRNIIWLNKNLFYSVSIGTIEWEGKKIFTVFKRIE
jgi:hypothetical protein